MKQFFMIAFLFGACSAVAQGDPYLHQYKKGKVILRYSYVQRNDSLFMYGHLQDQKINSPVVNINITIQDFRIGTVPGTTGDFVLLLPRKEGTIIFDKPGDIYFEFDYKFMREYRDNSQNGHPKRPSAHH